MINELVITVSTHYSLVFWRCKTARSFWFFSGGVKLETLSSTASIIRRQPAAITVDLLKGTKLCFLLWRRAYKTHTAMLSVLVSSFHLYVLNELMRFWCIFDFWRQKRFFWEASSHILFPKVNRCYVNYSLFPLPVLRYNITTACLGFGVAATSIIFEADLEAALKTNFPNCFHSQTRDSVRNKCVTMRTEKGVFYMQIKVN